MSRSEVDVDARWAVIAAIVLAVFAAMLFPLFARPRSGGGSHSATATARHRISQRSAELLRLGASAIARKQYERGVASFTEARNQHIMADIACLYIADARERQGRWRDAAEAYSDLVIGVGRGGSVAIDPVTRMRYALALVHCGDWHEAAAYYESAIRAIARHDRTGGQDLRTETGDASHNRIMAGAHLVVGSRRPTYGWLYGQPRFGQMASNDRLSHLREAVRLEPNWALAQRAYGAELEQRGAFRDAVAAYARAERSASAEKRAEIERDLRRVNAVVVSGG